MLIHPLQNCRPIPNVLAEIFFNKGNEKRNFYTDEKKVILTLRANFCTLWKRWFLRWSRQIVIVTKTSLKTLIQHTSVDWFDFAFSYIIIDSLITMVQSDLGYVMIYIDSIKPILPYEHNELTMLQIFLGPSSGCKSAEMISILHQESSCIHSTHTKKQKLALSTM